MVLQVENMEPKRDPSRPRNEEVEKFLAAAAAVAERRIRERFPEPPLICPNCKMPLRRRHARVQ